MANNSPKKSININHSNASILTGDDTFLQLSKNGAVKLGKGKNLEEDTINNSTINFLSNYSGAIRFNETTKKLEYCDGRKWVEFIIDEEDIKPSMVYSMIF